MTRTPRRAASYAALTALAVLAAPSAAPAQTTYTWSGGGGNGNWNNPGNWDTLPVSGTGSRIALTGTAQTATVQNFASPVPFVINRLQMNSGAANGFTVGGQPLQIAGAAAAIQSASTGGALVVNAPVDFAAATAVNLNANFTGGNEVVLAGPLSSPAGVALTVNGGIGTGLAVTGRNNTRFAGTIGFATGSQAIINLGAPNALGRAASVDLTSASATAGVRSATTTGTGPGFANAGFGVQLAGLGGTADVDNGITAGSFLIGNTGDPSAVLVGFGNTTSTLTSNTTTGAGLSAGNANSHFGKVGTGTFTYGGTGTFGLGSISVRDGAVVLQSPNANNGAFQNGTNAQGDVGVYAGATLRLNNGTGSANNQNRIGNTATVLLGGGTLQLDGRAGGAVSERVAGLNLRSGQSTVAVNAVDRGTRFTLVNSITASPTATVFFRGAAFGEVSSTSTTAAANGVNFDTLASVTALLRGGVTTGTYDPAAANLGIIPFATTGATAPDSLATFDAVTASVRRLADTNYAAAFGAAANNVSLSAAASAGGATANAVRLTAGGSIDVAANGLAITSGVLLNNGGGNVAGPGTVNFGSAAARTTAYVTTNGAMTIAAPVGATNLSKNGAGNLTLGGAVTLGTDATDGVVAVNAGTLTVGAGGSITNARTFQVSRGATLDVSAGGLTLGNGQTLTGGGRTPTGADSATVAGNVTLNTGATLAPSALNGTDPNLPNLASPATLRVGGNLALNGGSNYVWYTSSVLTEGDNAVPATATTLNNFKSPYTSGLLSVGGDLNLNGATATNRINLRITSLLLSNRAGAVYDLDKFADTRSWVIAEAGSITGFSPDKFTLNVTNFTNLAAGENSFVLSQVGNSLVLTFTPVPEPATVLGIAVAALGLAAGARRRWRAGPA